MRRTTRAVLVGLMVVPLLAVGAVLPVRAQAVTPFTLTLDGPASVGYGEGPEVYSGALSLTVLGVPDQPVEIRRDGAVAATTVTAGDGSYSVAVSFDGVNAGTYTLVAVANPGSLVEAQSDPLTVTVVPRPIEVTADPGQSKVVGEPDPPLTYSVTAGSLVGSDVFTGDLARDPGESIGVYEIAQGTLTVDDGNDGDNYDLSFVGDVFRIRSGFTAASISSGTMHSCGLSADGAVWCWGGNGFGQLGIGTTTSGRLVPGPSLLVDAVAITEKSGNHTCAVVPDETVRCWGHNSSGQLGTGDTTNRNEPTAVLGLTGATAVVGAGGFSCALLSDSTARCWGNNTFGQLGDGTTTDSTVPVVVSGLGTAVSLSGGSAYACAVLSDGTGQCWGRNTWGQLGDGTTVNTSTPVTVSGLSGVAAIGASSQHSCALLDDGTVRCWGFNSSGQLGDGTTVQKITPVAVSGLSGVVSVSVGGSHNCALLNDGSAWCWGSNSNGKLGDGTLEQRNSPVQVL